MTTSTETLERLASQLTGGEASDVDSGAKDAHREAVTTLISRHGESFTEQEVAELVDGISEESVERKRLIQ